MFRMTDEAYDILKKIAQYWLPAIAVAYSGLAKIWGWPYGVEIVGTISILDTLLGAILGISTKTFIEDQIKKIDKEE